MIIEPSFIPVGELFNSRSIYEVPKYQRAYAWEDESVEDFLEDTKTCYTLRKSGTPKDHFFGGILCIESKVSGTSNIYKYEVIDGQQRVTTYTILGKIIIDIYQEILSELDVSDVDTIDIIQERIKNLEKRFIKFPYEINMKRNIVDVLTLSKADNQFYRSIITGLSPTVERTSHKRIEQAHLKIYDEIKSLITDSNIINKIQNLEILEQVIDNNFRILQMIADNKEDAYRLFQVINDRGVSLTEGDLLRARTLERLEGHEDEQNAVEGIWNNILIEAPDITANYLTWIYESYAGRAKQGELYDKFLKQFFPDSLSHTELYLAVRQLEMDINICRQLTSLEWLYPNPNQVKKWDRNKLSLLLDTLGHGLSYSLLLAASELNQKKFTELIHIIEKVFFRYKIICKQHVTQLKNIYYEEAKEIRRSPSTYNLSSLKTKLNTLLDDKANDALFIMHLRELEYQPSGGNKLLRYFLLSVEYYYECYKNGNSWNNACIDKSHVIEFIDTSIEHIYPRNANETDTVPELEPLKNTLGNLSIMDISQNNFADNDPFVVKKDVYSQTSMHMLKDFSSKVNWTKSDVIASKKNMIAIACKVFKA